MKIVLIAGFSNSEIREHLKFRNDSRLYKLLIKTFGLPARVGEFRDYGPWVPNIIAEVEKHGDIELHVVGHQIRLKQSMQTFQMRGVIVCGKSYSEAHTMCDRWLKRLSQTLLFFQGQKIPPLPSASWLQTSI